MSDSPYQPPLLPEQEPSRHNELPPGTKSAVWPYYLAYCGAMAIMYLACVVGGTALFFNAETMSEAMDEEAFLLKIQGGMFAVIGLGLLGLYGAAPFLPKRKWAWIYGIVAIGIGMTSACCLPASIPLLIFWLKADNKAFFRV